MTFDNFSASNLLWKTSIKLNLWDSNRKLSSFSHFHIKISCMKKVKSKLIWLNVRFTRERQALNDTKHATLYVTHTYCESSIRTSDYNEIVYAALPYVSMRLSRLLGLRKFLVHLPSRFAPKKVGNFSITCENWYDFCALRKFSVLPSTMSIENPVVGASGDSVNSKIISNF